jgi:N-sulfoglucosamine sulfohydrolase
MRITPLRGAMSAILVVGSMATVEAGAEPPRRPNILWITCEDISPNLGCYGDAYAVTPNLDRLASQGVRYTSAFAPIGVCAPSRSSLITGMYAPSLGTQHMRCQGTLPDYVKCFPEYLRRAGYYCTNNVKTDYNFKHDKATWDESSPQAHWRKRGKDQPFFSVFNFTTSHESQIRLPEAQYQKRMAGFTPRERHDPAEAPIPPYHPDTPEVRRDWARYHDMITFMDKQAGEILGQLEADGLAGDTIVFFFSDHGAGMPRSKRWLYDSSTRVPLIVRFPSGYESLAPGRPGTATDRLVSFVDFGPTVLGLAGVDVPSHMQGRPFLGARAAAPREYVYGFRDRMDERTDLIRSVRDARYKYIRNYMPQLPWFGSQHISYMYEMPTMRAWQRLADQGKLAGASAVFMARSKPTEELYDTQADPFEVRNLADAPEHRDALHRLREAHRAWQEEVVDLGLLPEADLRTRFGNRAPYDAVRRDPSLYPLRRIADAADLANRRESSDLPKLVALLRDGDPAVRYWAAVGIGSLGEAAAPASKATAGALADPSPTVRVAAADALCRMGATDRALPALIKAMKDDNPWVRLQAIQVLDRLGDAALPALDALKAARGDANEYVVRVAEHAVRQLEG